MCSMHADHAVNNRSRADIEHDLADVGRAFHPPVGLGSRGQRKHRVDDRADAPIGNERPHVRLELARDGALFLGVIWGEESNR